MKLHELQESSGTCSIHNSLVYCWSQPYHKGQPLISPDPDLSTVQSTSLQPDVLQKTPPPEASTSTGIIPAHSVIQQYRSRGLQQLYEGTKAENAAKAKATAGLWDETLW